MIPPAAQSEALLPFRKGLLRHSHDSFAEGIDALTEVF